MRHPEPTTDMKWRSSATPLFIIIILLLTVMPAHGSYPLVRNFTRDVYRGANQNWAVAQNPNGLMFFGNKDGLLSFDGISWEIHYLDNFTTVRSLLMEDDRLYAGGTGTFGYFSKGEGGKLRYQSISKILGDKTPPFNEIWDIHRSKRGIWFQSDFYLFLYNGRTVSCMGVKDKITASAINGDRLYIALQNQGIRCVDGKRLSEPEGNHMLYGKRINSMVTFKDRVIVATAFDGLFELSGNKVTPLPTACDSFIKGNQVFSCAVQGSLLAVGTVRHGVVIIDMNTGETTYAGKVTGMQNNTVLTLFFDMHGNLWCGLDNGIDYILTNSPMRNLTGDTGNYGSGYVSKYIADTLYLGTNQGLYSIPYPIVSGPEPRGGTEILAGQIWDITEIGGDVLVCSDNGLFQLAGNRGMQISGINGCWCVASVPGHPDCAVVSAYDNFHILKKEGGGWKNAGNIKGFSDFAGKFMIDSDMNIWLSHWMKGIYQLHLNHSLTGFDDVKLFNSRSGLPTDENNSVFFYHDKTVVSTSQGFFEYNPSTRRMDYMSELTANASVFRPVRTIVSPDGDLWGMSTKGISYARNNGDSGFDIDSINYLPLAGKIIPGFENMEFPVGSKVILSALDGFFELDMKRAFTDQKQPPKPFVKKVTANGDSIIDTRFLGDKSAPLTLNHGLNSLKFEVALPEYRQEGCVRFSFRLDDFDKEWSTFSRSNVKEYTQLPEGHYTLRVRTRNSYDSSEQECAYNIVIRPPWYRSTPARLIYALLFVTLLFFSYLQIVKRARRSVLKASAEREEELMEKKRMAEKESIEKDYQIARLKSEQLEFDVKRKSDELSKTILNVARKNEILLDISTHVKTIKDMKPAERADKIGPHLRSIESLIKENIDRDNDPEDFAHNFDQAYDNFTQRLAQAHPEITKGDRLICCYLKMGLSSKEIAPLLKISYRSVEMRRHRLRNKLNLERDANLIDYLNQF